MATIQAPGVAVSYGQPMYGMAPPPMMGYPMVAAPVPAYYDRGGTNSALWAILGVIFAIFVLPFALFFIICFCGALASAGRPRG